MKIQEKERKHVNDQEKMSETKISTNANDLKKQVLRSNLFVFKFHFWRPFISYPKFSYKLSQLIGQEFWATLYRGRSRKINEQHI